MIEGFSCLGFFLSFFLNLTSCLMGWIAVRILPPWAGFLLRRKALPAFVHYARRNILRRRCQHKAITSFMNIPKQAKEGIKMTTPLY